MALSLTSHHRNKNSNSRPQNNGNNNNNSRPYNNNNGGGNRANAWQGQHRGGRGRGRGRGGRGGRGNYGRGNNRQNPPQQSQQQSPQHAIRLNSQMWHLTHGQHYLKPLLIRKHNLLTETLNPQYVSERFIDALQEGYNALSQFKQIQAGHKFLPVYTVQELKILYEYDPENAFSLRRQSDSDFMHHHKRYKINIELYKLLNHHATTIAYGFDVFLNDCTVSKPSLYDANKFFDAMTPNLNICDRKGRNYVLNWMEKMFKLINMSNWMDEGLLWIAMVMTKLVANWKMHHPNEFHVTFYAETANKLYFFQGILGDRV